ncbi:hypothetical protein [Stenotrophomonas maltophilia]|jgi:hypothetical protein|uniref:DUF2188 domain-containing protein n=1 Tax=Stenotrophomonas maltophilia TaxID=40324 RepID=A0A2W6ICG2_STEMA|nr:hypothetical protein [Stenotrophomonas maltophilia]PZS93358.1 hypothetical protein A7X83_06075 [Stenotrophomonas maltophilia]
MCQVKVGQMQGGLWSVAIERCSGNPARKDVVAGPRHSEQEAIAAGELLVKQNDCTVDRVEVQRLTPRPGVFG